MLRASYPTLWAAYRDVVSACVEEPDFEPSPRGQPVRERLAVTFAVEDPRARLITSPDRDANYGFAVGEFLWYWRADRQLKPVLYYNRRMRDYSDDGETLNSAYGWLLRTSGGEPRFDQWECAKRTLWGDPDSRRAVLQVHQPFHQAHADAHGSKDVPCTLSLQLFVRGGRLHMHASMRSNDAVWGLTYDAFSFTLLQEMMLLELRERMPDLELGAYHHTAGSMHVYSRHFDMCRAIARDTVDRSARMEPLASVADVGRLLVDERALRTREIDEVDLASYRGGERFMAERLNAHRRKRDSEERR